jgi:hypothetical protein
LLVLEIGEAIGFPITSWEFEIWSGASYFEGLCRIGSASEEREAGEE